ncbi:MAG: MFS transporter [Nocardioides sp.]|uniref:MFS transporter n=1 Tax=Nocardioides sp. TaxID=35761 RepID=UPI003F0EB5BB
MSLTQYRAAIALAFATQAFVFITLTTRLPVVAENWDVGTTGLSMILLMMVLVSGVGSVLAEFTAARASSALTLRIGFVIIAVAVPVVVTAPSLWLGVPGMVLYGLGLGLVDASTNMQAVALEHRYQRPILPSFHGAWTLGGVFAAAVALVSGGLPDWAPAVVAALPLLVAFAPYLPGRTDLTPDPGSSVPWRPIVLVGLAMALFYMVDIATQTWGATYAHEVFGTSASTAAAAVFVYLVASGLVRLAGDSLVARFGVVPVLRTGAVVGALGLGLVVAAPGWWAALVGFGLAGAGLAVVAPLSFSAAAVLAGGGSDPEAARLRVDGVIARFNLFNYAGALLGAVMTGLVGGADLRWGFAVPAVLVLGLLGLARSFAPAPGAGDAQSSVDREPLSSS